MIFEDLQVGTMFKADGVYSGIQRGAIFVKLLNFGLNENSSPNAMVLECPNFGKISGAFQPYELAQFDEDDEVEIVT